MKDRLEELLAKYWINRLSAEEKAELERMMWENPEYWVRTGLLQQVEPRLSLVSSPEAADKLADDILRQEKVLPQRRKRYRRMIWGVGIVSLLLIVGFIGYFGRSNHTTSADWQQVATKNGMKTMIRLADGTKVWLNAGSSLRYPKTFQQDRRVVYLEGEAYFNVNHEAGRPFIIHTDQLNARVLGTEVNIRAYPEEDYTEATLIRGMVNVTIDKGEQQKQFQLKPLQKIVVTDYADGKIIKTSDEKHQRLQKTVNSLSKMSPRKIKLQPIRQVDSSLIAETAWKNNTFLFKNEKLDKLAKRLDRWYGIDVIIKDSTLANQRFTGRADNVSLRKLLQILQMMTPFDYTIQGEKVIIQ